MNEEKLDNISLIIESFKAMKKSAVYLNEVEKITDEFGCDLPEDEDNWWIKTNF